MNFKLSKTTIYVHHTESSRCRGNDWRMLYKYQAPIPGKGSESLISPGHPASMDDFSFPDTNASRAFPGCPANPSERSFARDATDILRIFFRIGGVVLTLLLGHLSHCNNRPCVEIHVPERCCTLVKQKETYFFI